MTEKAPPPIDLAAAKKARQKAEYRSMVLKAFDDQEHAGKRAFLDHRAAVERANRDKL